MNITEMMDHIHNKDRQFLNALRVADQAERNHYKQFVLTSAGGDFQKGAQMYAQLKKRSLNDLFNDHSRMIRFKQHKFNFNEFNQSDWENFWIVAQHFDHDRDFQKKCLNAISQHLGTKSTEFQYLSDRISCGLTGTQQYGTQQMCKKDTEI